jgi:hypothetical protein
LGYLVIKKEREQMQTVSPLEVTLFTAAVTWLIIFDGAKVVLGFLYTIMGG